MFDGAWFMYNLTFPSLFSSTYYLFLFKKIILLFFFNQTWDHCALYFYLYFFFLTNGNVESTLLKIPLEIVLKNLHRCFFSSHLDSQTVGIFVNFVRVFHFFKVSKITYRRVRNSIDFYTCFSFFISFFRMMTMVR